MYIQWKFRNDILTEEEIEKEQWLDTQEVEEMIESIKEQRLTHIRDRLIIITESKKTMQYVFSPNFDDQLGYYEAKLCKELREDGYASEESIFRYKYKRCTLLKEIMKRKAEKEATMALKEEHTKEMQQSKPVSKERLREDKIKLPTKKHEEEKKLLLEASKVQDTSVNNNSKETQINLEKEIILIILIEDIITIFSN